MLPKSPSKWVGGKEILGTTRLRSIVGNEAGATAYKTSNSNHFREAVKLHDVDEFGKAKPTIHIKRNKAGERTQNSP
jgi:hypothetical protein